MTKKKIFTIAGIAVGAVIVIGIVIWLIFFRGGSDMDGDPNGYNTMPAEGAVTESEGETDTADGATSNFETVIGGATA